MANRDLASRDQKGRAVEGRRDEFMRDAGRSEVRPSGERGSRVYDISGREKKGNED